MRGAHATIPVRVLRSGKPALPRQRTRPSLVSPKRQPVVRAATANDVEAIHQLIDEHVADGRLLPRRRDEIAAHMSRFVERSPKCARSSSATTCDRVESGVAWWTSSPLAPRPLASTRSVRSRTWPAISCRWDSRSCRTRGCPRRSRPTADPAHNSAPAGNTPSCCRSFAHDRRVCP